MTLLDHLKADQAELTSLLQTGCERAQASNEIDRTMQALHQIYLETIDDALSVLHSMIDYLDKGP
jgi:hypothetical protein